MRGLKKVSNSSGINNGKVKERGSQRMMKETGKSQGRNTK